MTLANRFRMPDGEAAGHSVPASVDPREGKCGARAASKGSAPGEVPASGASPALIADVAILYCDPRGPYPKLVVPENCYDEARDARTYAGPWPVVAHPPCGPWGRLAQFCTIQKPMMHLGPIAVEQVRRWGGVLEHPEGSRLFDAEGLRTDGIGKVWYVEQGAWGHICQKRTWLYTVGVPAGDFWSKYRRARDTGRRVEDISKESRRRTPPAFAEWLISLARQATQPQAAQAEGETRGEGK